MPFIYKGSLRPDGGRVVKAFTMTDSQVLSEGEAVKASLTAGKIVTWGAGGPGLGIVVGFQKADGSPVTDNGAGGDYAGTYTAGSSNTVQALVDVSELSLYSVPLTGTLGTTNSSALHFNFDCDSASTSLVETSAVASAGTASFFVWEADTSEGAQTGAYIASIQESQVKL
jgi:hypothetical protein